MLQGTYAALLLGRDIDLEGNVEVKIEVEIEREAERRQRGVAPQQGRLSAARLGAVHKGTGRTHAGVPW